MELGLLTDIVKTRPLCSLLIQFDWFSYRKRKSGHTHRHQRSLYTEERSQTDTETAAVCMPRRQASGETKPVATFNKVEGWISRLQTFEKTSSHTLSYPV